MGASKNSSSTSAVDTGFATLAPRIKNISQSTIRKKWKPLPASSQEKVQQIFFDLKKKRSGAGGSGRIPAVVSKSRGGGSGTRPNARARVQEEEYEKAVEEVADKLLSSLPRMPFPPTNGSKTSKAAADDASFDLSATLHRIATLQAQLTMNMQSTHLLRMQIRREKAELRRDRDELAGLETALKSSQTLRRKREKGLHPLARAGVDDSQHEDEIPQEDIEKLNSLAGIAVSQPAPADRHAAGWFTSILPASSALYPSLDSSARADPELDTLLRQLRSHLLSMQNNTSRLQPVMAAIDDAKTTLDRFAVTTFDDEDLRRLCGF
ncbi:hypothetical protein A1O1_05457 [Capronia coronata CBS 617.96]|uniref:Uncharacterized protein n=1 Tax=Capronia coronata CBS 617.96 TaxID=1182541 RepID=W9Y6R8_9EURO|nr:uncharacterized protein A1O1_05457 [Capronia coronata CBS 617.96]EXJ88527.1 hypothetical protein A1O1_05457 [Capronia coronata CBS 617.96]